jgi:hypothetical protein
MGKRRGTAALATGRSHGGSWELAGARIASAEELLDDRRRGKQPAAGTATGGGEGRRRISQSWRHERMVKDERWERVVDLVSVAGFP